MQSNNHKISIIVPVYNVEDYIRKSVDSFLNQTFTDFELFLVDDGSIDKSGSICDEYSNKDNRINVIHQKNAGAHNARNAALKLASSKYVCFFDSDDYIASNMLYDLYNIAENYNSDLVVSGFYIETYFNNKDYIVLDYIPYTTNNSQIENFNSSVEFRKKSHYNFDRNMFYSPWNKLYKLSYLRDNNIWFPITYRDDFPFVLNVIKNISNVTYTRNQYYHFIRKRSDSETQKYVDKLYDKREEEHTKMISLFSNWGLLEDSDSFEMISRRYIDRLVECIVNLFNKECKLTVSKKKELIKQYLNSDNFNKCIKYAKPQRLYLKIIYLILKSKNVLLNYTICRLINFIKCNNIKLFSILKTYR